MKRVIIAFAVLIMWMTPVRAGAASPDALLSDADRRYQEQAIQNALEFNRTGEAESWENEATGYRGRVTPTFTYRDSAGQDCRKFERRLTIDGRLAEAWGTRCRTVAGTWLQPLAPRPVYTRGHHYPQPRYPHFRAYPYYPPVSLHLFYGIGHHRPARHYRPHRRHRPLGHHRANRHHRAAPPSPALAPSGAAWEAKGSFRDGNRRGGFPGRRRAGLRGRLRGWASTIARVPSCRLR